MGISSSSSETKSHNLHQKTNSVADEFLKWLKTKCQHDTNNSQFILEYFEQSNIIRLILTNTINGENENNFDMKKFESFINSVVEVHSSIQIAKLYVNSLHGDKQHLEFECIYQMFEDCLLSTAKLLNSNLILSLNAKEFINSMINSVASQNMDSTQLSNNGKIVSKDDLLDWILIEFPQIFHGYHNWVIDRIKLNSIQLNNKLKDTEIHDLSGLMNTTVTWYLISNLSTVYLKNLEIENTTLIEKLKNGLINHKWSLLYTSDANGLSLNRFTTHLFNYKAPTILFIYCNDGTCFCICSISEYKEFGVPYGDLETKIFQILPKFKSFDLKEPTKSIYLNTRSRVLRLGLIFGDNEKKPIIRIHEDFHRVDHETKQFDILSGLEVWGCGSHKEISHQKNVKDWENKEIEKMRTVKVKTQWNQNADKTILGLAGIQTDHSQRGDM